MYSHIRDNILSVNVKKKKEKTILCTFYMNIMYTVE